MLKTIINETEATIPGKTLKVSLHTARDIDSIDPFKEPEEFYIRLWVNLKNGYPDKVITEYKYTSYNDAYNAYRNLRTLL